MIFQINFKLQRQFSLVQVNKNQSTVSSWFYTIALLCTDKLQFLLSLELAILSNIHSHLLSFLLLPFDWCIQNGLKICQYLFGSIFVPSTHYSHNSYWTSSTPFSFHKESPSVGPKLWEVSFWPSVSERSVHLDTNLQIDLRSKSRLQQ